MRSTAPSSTSQRSSPSPQRESYTPPRQVIGIKQEDINKQERTISLPTFNPSPKMTTTHRSTTPFPFDGEKEEGNQQFQVHLSPSFFDDDAGVTLPDMGKLNLFDEEGVEGTGKRKKSQSSGSRSDKAHSPHSADASFQTPGLSSSTRTTDVTSPSSGSSGFPLTPFTNNIWGGNSSLYTQSPLYSPAAEAGNKKEKEAKQYDAVRGLFEGGAERIEGVGRYLLVKDIPPEVTHEQLQAVLQRLGEHKLLVLKWLQTKGMIIIAFYDPREASKVYRALRENAHNFTPRGPRIALTCHRIEKEVVERNAQNDSGWAGFWEFYESRVLIEVDHSNGVMIENMKKLLESFGDLERIQAIGHTNTRFLAEFYDTRHADMAVRSLHNQTMGTSHIKVKLFETRNLPEPRSFQRVSSGPSQFTLGSAATLGPLGSNPSARLFSRHQSTPLSSYRGSELDVNFGQSSFNTALPSPLHSSRFRDHPPSERDFVSDFGRRGSDPYAYQADLSTRSGERFGRPFGGGGLIDRKKIPVQNLVYPERILAGLDNRTTVMVKDVPNKLTRQELVDILSEVVPGEFDFVYLRFDFNNCCNVGYAFVNFTTTMGLYHFHKARVGKKWNLFSSEKVLQVSYADIQGKQALINKFRNSNVMEQKEAWRPQIFYSEGSLKGKPQPFPEADNLIMRQRAVQERYGTSSAVWGQPSRFDDSELYSYPSPSYDHTWTF